MIKNIVFGTSKEEAFNFLEELIGETKYKDIKEIKKYRNKYSNDCDLFIELLNGDTYEVRPASNNSRGCKCHKAFISRGLIDTEIYYDVILPIILDSDIPENERIIYFN